MNINICPVNMNNNYPKTVNNSRGYSRALKQDIVSFTALKKSMFKGIDFAVVEKFKSPIEKFKSYEDFQAWTDDEYFNLCMKDFGGRTGDVRHKRQSMVCDWDHYLVSGGYTSPERLLIMNGITKDLKPNNDNICPVFNRSILQRTLNDLKSALGKDRKLQFNFGKIYKENLVKMYSEHSMVNPDESKWIIIPSKDNDPVHFKENVEKLQTLSTSEMCTKYSGAAFHLKNGDIHIYMEKGKPRVTLRMNDGVVQEINGEHNDYRIPREYVEMTEQYLFDNSLVTTEKADGMLRDSKRVPLPEPPQKSSGGIWGFFKKLFS